MPTGLGLITSSALLSLGAASGGWPVKTFDPSDRGAECECMCWNVNTYFHTGSLGCENASRSSGEVWGGLVRMNKVFSVLSGH